MTQKPAADTPPAVEQSDPFAGLVPGRIVWYWPTASEAHYVPGPWAALVALAGNSREGEESQPGVVSLIVFLPEPLPVGAGGDPVERYRQISYSADGDPGSWSWPKR